MSGTQNAESGCFSSILRRILCQGSLQTHPSDQIPEIIDRAEYVEPKKKEPVIQAKIQTLGSPGVVAKLMGLDSLPEPNWVPTGKSPDSVTRSRSVNFMDYLLKFDLSQAAHQHRRVRTSVSFREVPTSKLHQQNNDNLFVMYLDGVNEKKNHMGSKGKKSGVEIGDLKQKKNKIKNTTERLVVKKEISPEKRSKRVSKFIDEPRRVSVKKHSKINRESGANSKKRSPVKPIIHQTQVLCRRTKATEKIKELEAADCSSENSSPVSVLDVSDFSIYDDDTTFSEKDSRYIDLNSKWKSSTNVMDSDYPSTCILSNNDNIEPSLMKKKDYKSMDSENTDYYLELVTKLCRFTEEAIMQSNWVPKKVLNFEDSEEICMEIGEQILATLLQQVVEELGGFNVENSAF
ncbi:hypothetical protein Ddye_009628 [Dipteronia dyeriana]|uniref:DUF3741 domain-containing protein n=1 Tax=Dipteronia dyeriana TaxID=168575 RepID=A0AAE0CMI1_9ROSI|nr:hypothetical protein Ddye_009628 [Dipteronia dyeriana]